MIKLTLFIGGVIVETIGCGRNEFEVEQLLQNAKNRLIELEPNLFDFMNYNKDKDYSDKKIKSEKQKDIPPGLQKK